MTLLAPTVKCHRDTCRSAPSLPLGSTLADAIAGSRNVRPFGSEKMVRFEPRAQDEQIISALRGRVAELAATLERVKAALGGA